MFRKLCVYESADYILPVRIGRERGTACFYEQYTVFFCSLKKYDQLSNYQPLKEESVSLTKYEYIVCPLK
jgi:hypothetical protein